MTRSHEIAGVLRDEILRGQFRPGERLPSERDLAARFGASRGAVREALSQIEQLRLIDIQPGGARIKEVNDASIAVLGPLLGLGSVPDAGLVDQFLDTFSALARFTATRAIPRITETQRTDLLAQRTIWWYGLSVTICRLNLLKECCYYIRVQASNRSRYKH
jgi:DNA-binding FadR family transcriptional regulator